MSTVSRRFHETLNLMTAQLEWLIKWPDREELWKTMPNSFRACYGVKVGAIVDCYEIKIERHRLIWWQNHPHGRAINMQTQQKFS